jgi:hypothetical protein
MIVQAVPSGMVAPDQIVLHPELRRHYLSLHTCCLRSLCSGQFIYFNLVSIHFLQKKNLVTLFLGFSSFFFNATVRHLITPQDRCDRSKSEAPKPRLLMDGDEASGAGRPSAAAQPSMSGAQSRSRP